MRANEAGWVKRASPPRIFTRNRYKYKLPLSYFPSRSSQAYFARLSLLRAVFSSFNSGMPRSIESFFSLWISRNLRVLFGFSRVSFPRTLPTHIAIFCLFCSIYTWLSNCFSKLGFLYFIFLSLYYVSLPNQFFPFSSVLSGLISSSVIIPFQFWSCIVLSKLLVIEIDVKNRVSMCLFGTLVDLLICCSSLYSYAESIALLINSCDGCYIFCEAIRCCTFLVVFF